jgi:hypothetical protein
MTTAAPATGDIRETAIFTYWLWPAIGIPFVILGFWGGFSPAFQSGAASAFMCGAIIAALGECLIDNYKNGFRRRFKATTGTQRYAAFGALILSAIFFFWNMYYAVADKKPHSGVDTAQVIVFLVAAAYLPQARFAFTEMRTPTLPEWFQWYAEVFSRIATMGGRRTPVVQAVVQAEVPEVQAEVPAPGPVIATGEGSLERTAIDDEGRRDQPSTG